MVHASYPARSGKVKEQNFYAVIENILVAV